MEISLVFTVHPSEDDLEELAFGRLSGDHLSNVEDHLLVCEACQTALEQTEQYIRLMKAAAASASKEPPRGLPSGRWNSIRSARTAARIGILGSASLIAVAFLPRHSPVPAAVLLASYRGGESSSGKDAAVNLAPALRPLDFSTPAADVPSEPEYRLEVVTESGRTVWTAAARPVAGELKAHMAEGLKVGHYWVRLYDQKAKLLSEFGLELK